MARTQSVPRDVERPRRGAQRHGFANSLAARDSRDDPGRERVAGAAMVGDLEARHRDIGEEDRDGSYEEEMAALAARLAWGGLESLA